MTEMTKDNPQASNVPFLTDELRRQIAEMKADYTPPKNMFPNCGVLGVKLTEEVMKAQKQQDTDEDIPLMSQGEMLTVLLAAHRMLAASMKQLSETMDMVLNHQKEQADEQETPQ